MLDDESIWIVSSRLLLVELHQYRILTDVFLNILDRFCNARHEQGAKVSRSFCLAICESVWLVSLDQQS